MAYAFIRSNTNLLVSCLIDDAKNDAVDKATEANVVNESTVLTDATMLANVNSFIADAKNDSEK